MMTFFIIFIFMFQHEQNKHKIIVPIGKWKKRVNGEMCGKIKDKRRNINETEKAKQKLMKSKFYFRKDFLT